MGRLQPAHFAYYKAKEEMAMHLFTDRHEAGMLLAEKMQDLKGQAPLFLAIPRGGVAVAHPLVQAIGGQLDLIIPRKIPSPLNRELGIGAVTGEGDLLLDEELIQRLGISRRYLEQEIQRQKQEIQRRLEKYRGCRPQTQVRDRVVVVVDDGVATGFTTRAALEAVQRQKPRQLILAVPVGPPAVIASFRTWVERVEVLATPSPFYAVAQFYKHFGQCSDIEVCSLLREQNLN